MMNEVKVVAKTKEEALNQVLAKLNANEQEVAYKFNEIKGGLFKGTTYECVGFLKLDVIDAVQNYLKEVLNGMGVDVNFEVSTKNEVTTIKMYSSNSSIIIGKNGQNLEALTIVARQFIRNLINNGPRIVLDVEDYKERKNERLERLAKNLAREVRNTHVDVEMDNMNSYERRIVHSVLADYKNIETVSVGEEPNRHVVIKYKE